MRETLANRTLTYGLLGLFVLMVAVPLFWMVTTALKPNKDLYEDFSYFPRRPTLEHFVRVIQRDELLTNIRNSLVVALTTTAVTVVVSALAAFSIVRYRYRGREWIGRVILFKYLLPSAMLFVPLYAIVTSLGHLRLVMKAFDLGGGQWRYEYGVQNYDFDPRIKSFTVPLPPGVTVTSPGFHDPDQDAGNNWTATIGPNAITFAAPSAAAAQDYDTLFNFRFTVNAAPSAAGGVVVSMRAQETRSAIKQGILGPGTPTAPR